MMTDWRPGDKEKIVSFWAELCAAAWKTRGRDAFIGWTAAQRQAHLGQVANNSRFLILPWVRVPELASHILGRVGRRIAADWQGVTAIGWRCWRRLWNGAGSRAVVIGRPSGFARVRPGGAPGRIASTFCKHR
jgi:hypothetical protein